MDEDVIASALGVLGLASLASVLGYRLGFRLRPSARLLVLAVVMLVASLYASLLVGRLELVSILPDGSAIFATNITPVLILFSVGLAWTIPSRHLRGRQVRFAAITALSIVFFFAPLLRPWLRPVVSDDITYYDHGVCLQSHSATCGAAAAATLLHLHGIDVSEHTMIEACLTSRDGTEPLGLYRGLASGSRTSHKAPNLASSNLSDWESLGQYPLVALVTFRHDMEPTSGALRRMLGRDADGHAVVVFGRSATGDFMIGDPAVGRTVWDEATLHRRYCGQAIFMAER